MRQTIFLLPMTFNSCIVAHIDEARFVVDFSLREIARDQISYSLLKLPIKSMLDPRSCTHPMLFTYLLTQLYLGVGIFIDVVLDCSFRLVQF